MRHAAKLLGPCWPGRAGSAFCCLRGITLRSMRSLETLRQGLLHYCRTGKAQREAHGLALRAREVERLRAAGVFPSDDQRALWQAACAEPCEPLRALLSQSRGRSGDMGRDSRQPGDLSAQLGGFPAGIQHRC